MLVLRGYSTVVMKLDFQNSVSMAETMSKKLARNAARTNRRR
jgi:hypothetical protein